MSKKVLLIAVLVVAASFAASPASACSYACVELNGCETCRNVGSFTGGYCQNVAPCICIDVQDVCSAPQVGVGETVAVLDLSPTAEVCGGAGASETTGSVL